jgi:hypothetical protein
VGREKHISKVVAIFISRSFIMPTPIAASWQSANGDWFVAANWVEIDPTTNQQVDYVPGAMNSVTVTGATVTYNGTDEIYSLGGNATLDINGGSLTVDNTSSFGGGINVAAGAALYAAAGATLTYGSGAVDGTLGGAGAIDLQNGSFTLGAGTVLSVANLALGGTTTLTTDLSYSGNFISAGTLTLEGHTLTVSGTSNFGGDLSDSGLLKITGSATLGDFTPGPSVAPGTATIEDAGSIVQNGSLVVNGTLQIDSGATYTMNYAPSTAMTTIFSDRIINNGAFINGATGVEGIYGAFTNNGTLSNAVSRSMLSFSGPVTGTGSAVISGGAALIFYEAFNQNVAFQGAGVLWLAQSYSGVISGFALGNRVDLLGVPYAAGEHMVFQSLANGAQTYALEDASSTVLATLSFSGHYSAALFQAQQGGYNGSIISLAAPPTAAAGDYNQDGVSDLLWQSRSSGDVYEWQMSGGQPAGSLYLDNLSGWSALGAGDFYGAGATADILWQSQSTGAVYEWQMSGGQRTGSIYLGNLSGWNEIGIGDFYGAGTDDLLWRNQSTGDVYEWTMSNGQHSGNDVYLGNLSGWNEVGVGDFQGAGTDDLLWQSQSTGAVYEWTMSNGQHTGSIYLGNLSGWSEVGVGDFYGNGTSDLLWQNQTTGDVYEWQMSGGQHVGNDVYLGRLSGWSVVGTGDYSGNGVSDIIWQNQSSGATYEWTMSNGQQNGSIYLGNLAGWSGK